MARPCAAPAFWLISAITPAIAGVETEVPPTSCAEVVLGEHEPSEETQIRYALCSAPSAAKKLTSGISRTPSFGTPDTPVCQLGFTHPSLWRAIEPFPAPVVVAV